MAVDLQELLAASSGERIASQSAANQSFLALLDRVFLKLASETDPIQAASISQIIARSPVGSNGTANGG